MSWPRRMSARTPALLWLVFATACVFQPSPTPQTLAEEWSALLPVVIAQASDFQRDILADGVVTAEENERAQAAYVDCLETVGLRVIAVEVDDDGLLRSLAYETSAIPSDAAAQERVELECHSEFYSAVEAGWVAAVSGDDSDEAFFARVSRCLRSMGHDVPISPDSGQDLLEGASESVEAAFRVCAESAQAKP